MHGYTKHLWCYWDGKHFEMNEYLPSANAGQIRAYFFLVGSGHLEVTKMMQT